MISELRKRLLARLNRTALPAHFFSRRLHLERLELRTTPATGVFPGPEAIPWLIADPGTVPQTLVAEIERNDTPTTANRIEVRGRVTGEINRLGDVDYFAFTMAQSERFTARVSAAAGSSLDPRLTLFASSGQELVTSDEVTGEGMLALVDQHLLPGTYILRVSAQVSSVGGSLGRYDLLSNTVPASPPTGALPVGGRLTGVAVADVNSDRRPDLVTANPDSNDVSVLLGNGDGSFQEQRRFSAGVDLVYMAVADVNTDGRPDLVTANDKAFNSGPGNRFRYGGVSVLLGKGDGSFETARTFGHGVDPVYVAVADVNSDGRPDLITANAEDFFGSGSGSIIRYGGVSVLLGNGDGSFQDPRTFGSGGISVSVAVADINSDGRPDLVAANTYYFAPGNLSVLLGNGDGSFQEYRSFAAGDGSNPVTVADFNSDGRPDLVTANTNSSGSGDGLSVLLGNGDGSFQEQRRLPAGVDLASMEVADVNSDGRSDIVTANTGGVSVLLGDGNGSFQGPWFFGSGVDAASVAVADVNSDGRPDIVSANDSYYASGYLSVLLGNGDGSFQEMRRVASGATLMSLVVEDVNADGRADLITGNTGFASHSSGSVSVLLGNGDGSFQEYRSFAAGVDPQYLAVAVADLNRDGRSDLVTANASFVGGANNVSVLLGNGDGSFQEQRLFAGGYYPLAVAVADVNGDHRADLVIANDSSTGLVVTPAPDILGSIGGVSVLLGNGDGSFQDPLYFRSDGRPRAVAVADVNNDRRADLVLANIHYSSSGGGVSVLLGNGDGSFQDPRHFAAEDSTVSTTVADVNNDGRPDLVTANSGGVSLLLGNGDGSFQAPRRFITGVERGSVLVADMNGDGRLDLLTGSPHISPHLAGGDVFLLLGNGDGSFQEQRSFAGGMFAESMAVNDINNDGRADLVVSYAPYSGSGGGVSVLLGQGDGSSIPFGPDQTIPLWHTPRWGDINHDSVSDTVVLDDSGAILFRRGLSSVATQLFAPPVVLNPDLPARDITVVKMAAGLAVAASDVGGDTVSVYAFTGASFSRTAVLQAGRLPQRIAAKDLNGDGFDDLVIANSLDNTVSITFQQYDGSFTNPRNVDVGVAPSDLAFSDADGEAGPHLIVSNLASGDVTILYNDPDHTFARTARYRAGLAPSGLRNVNGRPQTISREEPVSIVAGLFTADTRPDLVVISRGAHRFGTLVGTTGGGFTNPQESMRFSTSQGPRVNDRPGQAVADDFNRDGKPDVAILMEDRGEVWLYLGQGDGTFSLRSTVSAGNVPTGLSVADVNNDRQPDLLVGNGFGDVLFILGNGDGTFRPFVRADQRVPFLVTDLDGDGVLDVVLADQARDLASSQVRIPGTRSFTPGAFQRDASNGLIGPGDVAEADFDGLYGSDLIFANTGSNNVLVYLRQADNSFADTPLSFFAGTNPSDLQIAQLTDDNGDGVVNRLDLPDVVIANQGSNDVSVLLGSQVAGTWTFLLGPRLRTGGFGVNAVTTRDVNGDGIPDVLATNGQDGTLGTIPGIGLDGAGTGFFDDTNIIPSRIAPGPIRQTDIVDNSLGFALTQQGTLRSFNLTTGAGQDVFAAREVNAFQAVGDAISPFPLLFTANRGGSVSVLTTEDGQGYTEHAFIAYAIMGDPGALQVLEVASGLFEVYLTDATMSQPIVLTFDLRAGLVPVEKPFELVATLLTDLTDDVPQVETTRIATEVFNPLIVGQLAKRDVGTVVAGGGAGNPAGEMVLLAPTEALLPGLTNLLALVTGGDHAGGFADEADEVEEESPTTVKQFISGLDEGLMRLNWGDGPRVKPPEDEGKHIREALDSAPGERHMDKTPEVDRQEDPEESDLAARVDAIFTFDNTEALTPSHLTPIAVGDGCFPRPAQMEWSNCTFLLALANVTFAARMDSKVPFFGRPTLAGVVFGGVDSASSVSSS